jgi:hypothetical protein
MERPDALRDQVGVLKVASPDRAIETLCDEIDEAIAVGGMNVKPRVLPRHLREHGGEVGWTESKRHGNSQAAAKVAGGEDRFPGRINLGAGSGRMVSERDSGFRERGAAGRSCKKLDAKVRFNPKESPADD